MSTAPSPPNAPLADIYDRIIVGQTVAVDEYRGIETVFLVHAKSKLPSGDIRVYGVYGTGWTYTVAENDPNFVPTGVYRLLNPDGSVLWERA